jgi:hypothetical protein
VIDVVVGYVVNIRRRSQQFGTIIKIYAYDNRTGLG